MSSDFLEAREQQWQDDELFQARASRFRPHIARVAILMVQPIPTHSHEQVPSLAQRDARRKANSALLERIKANRLPEERQAALDLLTRQQAQEKFAELPVEVQVELLRSAGVDIERRMIEPTQDDEQGGHANGVAEGLEG